MALNRRMTYAGRLSREVISRVYSGAADVSELLTRHELSVSPQTCLGRHHLAQSDQRQTLLCSSLTTKPPVKLSDLELTVRSSLDELKRP